MAKLKNTQFSTGVSLRILPFPIIPSTNILWDSQAIWPIVAVTIPIKLSLNLSSLTTPCLTPTQDFFFPKQNIPKSFNHFYVMVFKLLITCQRTSFNCHCPSKDVVSRPEYNALGVHNNIWPGKYQCCKNSLFFSI